MSCTFAFLVGDGSGGALADETGALIAIDPDAVVLCPDLPDGPAPAIDDALSDPAAEQLAPLVEALAPRGAAWRRDEAADPGKPGVMGGVWRLFAGVFADLYRAAFQAAKQTYPSTTGIGLVQWERELGLPDPCLFDESSEEARRKAVSLKYADRGGASPHYFICLIRRIGYEATIEEPSGFECSVSECLGCDETTDINLNVFWIITVSGLDLIYFRTSESVAGDRLLDWNAALDLECFIRARAPMHTVPIFHYN